MTAFISEFRSMTFQCKSQIQFSGANNGYDHGMPPRHQDLDVQDASSKALEARESQVSPVSSLGGTSVESSSPVMTTPNGTGHRRFELDRPHHMVVDPSSDDSGSMTNDASCYQGETASPLEQLQCALGKDGMLGQKLHLADYPGRKDPGRSAALDHQALAYFEGGGEAFKCHLCSFATGSKQDFNAHMNSHFDHKCPFCDYTSRTEGRLKRHVKDFHSETPPESWAGTRVPRAGEAADQSADEGVTSSNGKPRTYRCKQCDFVAYQKNDFWEHNKSHIKAEKLLSCPQCAFVTEYKHHLEYHIRNHFGSKPFKCSKCNYSCVNKSMLNSHMKSHSNIYQYRCANCTYATKYCHSLKLHLRKYEHKPATVLNMDGTPNPYPVIDVYGTRRGPRTKKRRCLDDSENTSVSSTAAVSSQPSLSYPSSVPLLPPNVPVMYPQFFNGYPNSMFMKAHQPNESHAYPLGMTHVRVKHDSPFKCIICDFVTDHQEMFHKHMILHAAAENQDLVKLYGINSESLLHFQDQLMFNSYLQGQKYLEHQSKPERKGFDTFEQQRDRLSNGYQQDAKAIKEEEENSNNSQRSDKSTCPKTVSANEVPTSLMTPHSAFKDERAETEDNERTVIVAHKSSPRPPNVPEAPENSFAPHFKSKNVDHSPLDLSGPKPSDSAQKSDGSKTPDANFENDEVKIVSPNGTDHSGNQRNRRKGKAFKIDHYMQLDQPVNSETPTPISYQTLPEESQRNQIMHSSQDSAQLQPEVLATRENRKLMQEASEEVPYQHSNPVNCSGQNPSPHYSLDSGKVYECYEGESRKSCSPVILKDSAQYSKEMPLNHGQNSSQAQNVLSKMEIESEQKSNPAKRRQEIFECEYCAMAFRDCVMYTVHMGYHGFGDPFTCNMCGQESKNRVEFFIHIARAAHV